MSGSKNDLPSRLLVITDRHQTSVPLPKLCEHLLAAGLRWLWLRDRDLPSDERRILARALATAAARHGATLTIGADVGLAAEVGAGVQLGASPDLPAALGMARRALGAQALIGVSAHSFADLRTANAAGADYATLSPILPSASKPGYGPALGLAALGEAAATGLPVLALGGVTAETARDCLAAGAAGVAVMGEAMRSGALAVAEVVSRWERLPDLHCRGPGGKTRA